MNTKGGSTLSRGFVLSIAALIIWGSAGVSILQFLGGGEFAGVLFAVVAVMSLVVALEGSLVDRLAGRATSRANMLVFVAILVLVGINELWGFFLIPRLSGSTYLAHLIFTVGLLAMIAVTAVQAIRLPRSS